MRIAIDARWILPEISGIGQYTTELIRHLAKQDRRNEYILIFRDSAARSRALAAWGRDLPPHFSTRTTPYGVFSPWNQAFMPRLLTRWRVDLYHSTNYMIPLAAFPRNRKGRIRCVTTVHDVIPLIFPDHAPKSRKARLFPLFVRILREVGIRSHAILTVSRASAADILRHLRIPPASADRVHPIYNGVSGAFRPAPGRTGSPAGGKTILYVGRADPYKNLVLLIRAFAAARESLPFPLRLLIVGPPDKRYPEAPDLARQLGLSDAVQWTGYLSEERIVTAYQNADLLVHPSRYEGFGLQVLEAMACGVPVLSSNAGALPEVIGDAGLLFAPDDLDGFVSGIRTVLTDRALADSLARKGLLRARDFSWERTAAETLRVYTTLAAREPPSTMEAGRREATSGS